MKYRIALFVLTAGVLDRALAGEGETGALAGNFTSFLLAQTWSPEFCRTQCPKGSASNCMTKPGSFAASHLSLHGLWPNYKDSSSGYSYPQFCKGGPAGDFEKCSSGSSSGVCKVPSATIDYFDTEDRWQKYAPGYSGGIHFLADHEWPKHGSCVGEGVPDAKTYFAYALALDKEIAEGKVAQILTEAIGSSVSADSLLEALGGKDSSELTCDHGCVLSGVYTCWGIRSDTDKSPGARAKCPPTAKGTCYGCTSVHVNAYTPCGTPPSPTPGEQCVVGQHGPPCTYDSDCADIPKCLRCARSGYCTANPLSAEW